jgi:hypothetical protein
MQHSSPKKNGYEKEQFQRAPGSQWESFEALAYINFLLQGNLWFLDYFDLFFAFFFAFGTEITCRYNVGVVGLTLPTAAKFCPRCQTSTSELNPKCKFVNTPSSFDSICPK